MGIDASNQIILASGRVPGVGGEHVLTKVKISMLSSHEARKIHLPANTKAAMDICILPGGSAIFASLGRRLSLFSMMTNSVVLQCDLQLPAPGWSCLADESSSHHVYAVLQNGMLLVYDIRQTARPLHSMVGLSTHPVHTLHSAIHNNGSRKVLSASIVPCMWDADGNQSSDISQWTPSGQRSSHQKTLLLHHKCIYHKRQHPLVQENQGIMGLSGGQVTHPSRKTGHATPT